MIRATTVDEYLQDLQRVLGSIPKMELTRRGFVMTALGRHGSVCWDRSIARRNRYGSRSQPFGIRGHRFG